MTKSLSRAAYEHRTAQRLVNLIRECLTDDLRLPHEQGDPHPTRNHCYVASEALYHLLREHGIRATVVRLRLPSPGTDPDDVFAPTTTHWWLRVHGIDVDPTYDQYDFPVPYYRGRPTGFVPSRAGAGPSARARELIRRVNDK